MKKYVLALDQGTTSSRAIVFDREGAVRAVAQKEFAQHYPRPGWVEHDALEIWSSQLGTAAEVLARANIASSQIAAVGIANQRETTVVWNRRTGEPVGPAIVWQDRRTAREIDALKADGLEGLFTRKTGLVLDAYFSGSKLAWMLNNLAGAREQAEAGELLFGTVDTWLVWKLTGGAQHVTDVSNACRTMLFNIHTLDWDDELLRILGVPRSMLPAVRASSEVYGEATQGVLRRGVPIAGLAGDQQAASFGQVCFEPGMGKNTYGTGCFMLMNTGREPKPSEHRLLTTVAWRLGEKVDYALEGSIFVAGATVQWLRDGLGLIRRAEDVEALAKRERDNGGIYLVPAFVGLGAPHWDPYARGSISGITRGTTAGHLARAALEGIAYQVTDVVRAMEADAGVELEELRVDGGAAKNDLLMQFQADILNVPVVRPQVTETTALGAAYLAGLAVGYWTEDELASQWQQDRRFEPEMAEEERARLLDGWQEALGRAKGWEKG